MRSCVTYLVRDGVAIIEISAPPCNGLTPPVRKELDAALCRATSEPEVKAVVLRARGRSFGSMAHPDEIDPEASNAPSVRGLCQRLEQLSKPVVAALHGAVFGASADLATACHYRIAQAGTTLSFPDIRHGLMPSGGAARRLPHIVGAEAALDLLLGARTLDVGRALSLGLIDRQVQDKASVAAFAFARDLIARGEGPRPVEAHITWSSDPDTWLAAVARVRAGLPDDALTAARELASIVEAALLLPRDEAEAFDASAYHSLRRTDEVIALCRLGLAERRAGRLPQRLGAVPRPLGAVGVLGAGRLGMALATRLLDADLDVVLACENEDDLEEAFARIGEIYDARVAAGRLSEDDVDERLDRLRMACGFKAFGSTDVIIDVQSTSTSAAIKAALHLDPVLQAGAVMAFVSPDAAIGDVARSTSRSGDVLGLRLVGGGRKASGAEIITLSATSRHASATTFQLLRRLGILPVMSVDDAKGLGIGARLSDAVQGAADSLLASGARFADIEVALADWAAMKAVFSSRHAAGASAAGLAMTAGATALAVEQPGTAPGGLTPQAIRRLCLAAAVNEGARLISDGIALCPSDIDVLAVHTLGHRRRTGGPMTEGDLAGLLSLRRALPRIGQGDGIGGAPHPLLDDLIKNGRGFASLDAG
jgi:3-hydroxyacyl-CoA dehydrogenase